jgi:MoaA/NifB/PqqE/SkfB family radical SAM enzyme
MLVFYEVTQACDLICQHCRACAQSHRHPFELGTDESKRMISQLAEFPVPPMLVLTGGDPLKRSDIFELIEHAVAQPPWCRKPRSNACETQESHAWQSVSMERMRRLTIPIGE